MTNRFEIISSLFQLSMVLAAAKSELNKCCPNNEFFEVESKSCRRFPNFKANNFKIEFSAFMLNENVSYVDASGNFLPTRIHFPNCKSIEYKTRASIQYYLCPANQSDQTEFFLKEIESNQFAIISEDESVQYTNFCIDRGFSLSGQSSEIVFEGTVAVFCRPVPSQDCLKRPCIQRCCSRFTVFNPESHHCGYSQFQDDSYPEIEPVFHDNETGLEISKEQLFQQTVIPFNQFGNTSVRMFYDRLFSCDQNNSLRFKDDFKLYANGNALVGERLLGYKQYCLTKLEYMVKDLEPGIKPVMLFCEKENSSSIDNNKRPQSWASKFNFIVLPSFFCISIIFMGLLIGHLWIRSKAKLFGSMMLSAVVTLTMFYITITAVKFSSKDLNKTKPHICKAMGFMVQFTYLSGFFWLNALSFDVWINFRNFKPMAETRLTCSSQREPRFGCTRPRYKWYALYAWGGPLILVLITIIIQFLPEDMTSGIILPQIGKQSCFFKGKKATFLYLNLIAGPILFSNVVFFISFVYNLCWGVWASSDIISRNQQQKRLKAVLKMFFVMGVIWFAEVLSWGLDWIFGAEKIQVFSSICDIINSLQGLIMFCVIYFDTETINRMRIRFAVLIGRPLPNPSQCTASQATTTTSFSSANSRQNTREEKRKKPHVKYTKCKEKEEEKLAISTDTNIQIK